MGRPKALVRGTDGTPWVERATKVLLDAGCAPVVVVLGADAETARGLVPDAATVVVATDWADGMGASLRTGLAALADTDADAAVVLLVDLPDVGPEVVSRLVEEGADAGEPADALARSAYWGMPGHPVLLGRHHWDPLSANVIGDRGARDYLAATPHSVVECGDLATGRDVDTPAGLA